MRRRRHRLEVGHAPRLAAALQEDAELVDRVLVAAHPAHRFEGLDVDAAKESRAESRNIDLHLRLTLVGLARALAILNGEAPGAVGKPHRIHHAEGDIAFGVVVAGFEQRGRVDHAQPQEVVVLVDLVAAAVGESPREMLVVAGIVEADSAHEIERTEEFPHGDARVGRAGHEVHDVEGTAAALKAPRRVTVEFALLVPVADRAGLVVRFARGLVDGAVADLHLGRAAADRAGLARVELLEDVMRGLGELGDVDVFAGAGDGCGHAEAGAGMQLDGGAEDRGAEPETPVDRRFGCGEGRNGEPLFLRVRERFRHEGRGDALAAMGGEHGDFADLVAVDDLAANVQFTGPVHEGGDGNVLAEAVGGPFGIENGARGRLALRVNLQLVFEELLRGVGVVESLLDGGEPGGVPGVIVRVGACDVMGFILEIHECEASKVGFGAAVPGERSV